MRAAYSGEVVNGNQHPKAWNCDICGGYFTIEDAGYISDTPGCADVCEECRGRGFDDTSGETIN